MTAYLTMSLQFDASLSKILVTGSDAIEYIIDDVITFFNLQLSYRKREKRADKHMYINVEPRSVK